MSMLCIVESLVHIVLCMQTHCCMQQYEGEKELLLVAGGM